MRRSRRGRYGRREVRHVRANHDARVWAVPRGALLLARVPARGLARARALVQVGTFFLTFGGKETKRLKGAAPKRPLLGFLEHSAHRPKTRPAAPYESNEGVHGAFVRVLVKRM